LGKNINCLPTWYNNKNTKENYYDVSPRFCSEDWSYNRWSWLSSRHSLLYQALHQWTPMVTLLPPSKSPPSSSPSSSSMDILLIHFQVHYLYLSFLFLLSFFSPLLLFTSASFFISFWVRYTAPSFLAFSSSVFHIKVKY